MMNNNSYADLMEDDTPYVSSEEVKEVHIKIDEVEEVEEEGWINPKAKKKKKSKNKNQDDKIYLSKSFDMIYDSSLNSVKLWKIFKKETGMTGSDHLRDPFYWDFFIKLFIEKKKLEDKESFAFGYVTWDKLLKYPLPDLLDDNKWQLSKEIKWD